MRLLFTCLSLLSFLSFSQEWVQKANVPANGRHGPFGFSIGNKGYFGGGQINSGTTVIFTDFWQYDPASNSWTQKADLPASDYAHTFSFSTDTCGYVTTFSNLLRYSPVTNSFTLMNDVPGPFSSYTNFIYMKDSVLVQDAFDIYSYYPDSDTWSFLMTTSQYADKIFKIDTTVYSFAWDGTQMSINSMNWQTQEWEYYCDFVDTIWYYLQVYELNGKAYFLNAHWSEFTFTNLCWEFDPADSSWTELEDFQGQGRRYYADFKLNGSAYFIAGTNGTNMNDVWEFIPPDTTTPPPIITPPEPPPGPDVYSLCPNPSTDFITIHLGSNILEEEYRLVIVDAAGKILPIRSSFSSEFVLNKQDFAAGTYWYRILKAEENLSQGRFVFL